MDEFEGAIIFIISPREISTCEEGVDGFDDFGEFSDILFITIVVILIPYIYNRNFLL
jgi:hypothetical protein